MIAKITQHKVIKLTDGSWAVQIGHAKPGGKVRCKPCKSEKRAQCLCDWLTAEECCRVVSELVGRMPLEDAIDVARIAYCDIVDSVESRYLEEDPDANPYDPKAFLV